MNISSLIPQIFNCAISYGTLNYAQQLASVIYNGDYYGIYFTNLRRSSEVSSLPLLQAVSTGFAQGSLTCTNGDRHLDITPIDGGHTITFDMAVGE